MVSYFFEELFLECSTLRALMCRNIAGLVSIHYAFYEFWYRSNKSWSFLPLCWRKSVRIHPKLEKVFVNQRFINFHDITNISIKGIYIFIKVNFTLCFIFCFNNTCWTIWNAQFLRKALCVRALLKCHVN